jgi:hypothetical protein
MIERSRRTVSTKPTLDALRLHERLASQRLWFFRLLVASGLALILSALFWLVRVPLMWHLLGITLGFLAGLFVQRPTTAWALAWITERAGLSYETALEQSQDDYGFASSLKERATEEASRLPLPKYQAWWLPMLALALGLAFLPLVPSLTSLPSPLTELPSTATLPEVNNQPANTVEPAQPQATSQAAEPPPGSQAASQDTSEADTSQLSDATGSSPSASNNQSADEQALDRFLENLRQNETTEEGAPDVDLSSVMQPSGGSSGGASDEDRASRPRSEQTNPFSQGGEPREGAAQQDQSETSQGQQDSQTNESQDGAEQGAAQGEQGQENTDGSEQGASEDGAGEQSAGEQGAQQGEGQQGEGQQAESEQSQAGSGENGSSAAAQGDEQGSDSGQNASGAGNLPGAPTGQSTEVIGSSQQNPDFLPGQLSEGTTNIAGTARLPGETNETVFPKGSAPGSFSRAEEEALTEGRIPLEYQEVIRNYFGGAQ